MLPIMGLAICGALYSVGLVITIWGAVRVWLRAKASVREAETVAVAHQSLRDELSSMHQRMLEERGSEPVSDMQARYDEIAKRRHQEQGLEVVTFGSFDPTGSRTAARVLGILSEGNGRNVIIVGAGAALQTAASIWSLFI